MKSKVIAIGSGDFVIRCLSYLIPKVHISLVFITEKPQICHRLVSFCVKNNIKYLFVSSLKDNETFRIISDTEPDIIFSINNFKIIPNNIVSIAKKGVINFHNSLLPKYAGLNPCSWAIINNEDAHGVTWHFVEELIDGGDILAQCSFDIDESDNAKSLIIKSFKYGYKCFVENVDNWIDGPISSTPQSISDIDYYSSKDKPDSEFISFDKKVEDINRLFRACDFFPLPNLFFTPKVRIDNCVFSLNLVNSYTSGSNGAKVGEVIVVDDDTIKVQLSDGVALFNLLPESSL
ncbi:hypothetical protein L1D11_09200 [Vibrio sp. Isolate32]|uniref:methionyl-tRNA formyltransferase n=2 Tax=unclassified Vibrio TaxID=2614977 RepID=UPI001EFCBDD3|nr:formyltransferase family protein [Vibrio sp. Isolate32]MCG9553553.1 hypothetical protein [Vibrio sp. Isolate32]